MIKSIQRGVVRGNEGAGGDATDEIYVTISNVNISKSVVILNEYSQSIRNYIGARYEFVSSTQLYIIGHSEISWQVIEFN